MKYSLSLLPFYDYYLLSDLAKEVSLNEELSFNCDFLVAKDNDKIIGAIGYNMKKKYPQLEHIIITKKYQHTRLLVILAMAMEKLLKDNGYDTYVSYILDKNEHMQTYAKKWGMNEYNPTLVGKWFFKKMEIKNEKMENRLVSV